MSAFQDDFSAWDLDFDEIRSSNNVVQLTEWWLMCGAVKADIKGQLEASAAANYDDPAWVYKAVKSFGYHNRCATLIRRQLKVLGADPEPDRAEIGALQDEIQRFKGEVEFAKHFAAEVGSRLGEDELAHTMSAANQRMNAAFQERKAKMVEAYDRKAQRVAA